jgi:hypothetical protein
LVPVILFAYARPDHLRQTLRCLQQNHVPSIYAFSDGPRTPDKVPAVAQVRNMLRAIDWCKVVLCERETNLGLGRSILTGVTEVLAKHEAAIIFEDDLICVPGTYAYLCAALNHYRNDPRVMSVTGWTHPRVTPRDVTDMPYFDGRAECLVWGTWVRAWRGMETDAKTLMEQCSDIGIDVYKYGADLVAMANAELAQNIWAVRFLYLHLLHQGLCLRPPWSMVEHTGFDSEGTNAKTKSWLENPPLRQAPPIPAQWPQPLEHPDCSRLHRAAFGARPTALGRSYHFVRAALETVVGRLSRGRRPATWD